MGHLSATTLLLLLLLHVQTANGFPAKMTSTHCSTPLTAGTRFMCCDAQLDSTRIVQLKRNGVALACDVDTYVQGEILTAHMLSAAGISVFEVAGGDANFVSGSCQGNVRRLGADGVAINVPTDGSNLSLWAAWTTSFSSPVSITPACTLQQQIVDPDATTTTVTGVDTTSTPTDQSSFLADRGYARVTLIGPDVKLYYSRQNDDIKLALDCPTTGWCALALGTTMSDADAVIGGGLKGGGQASDTRAYKLTSKDADGVNEDPTATAQLLETEVLQVNGRTGVIFTRPLDNGVRTIKWDGTTPLLWAYGSGHSINYHGSNNKAVEINFATGISNEDTTMRDKKVAHGVLMMVSWGVFISLGTLAGAWGGPHFKIGGKLSFNVHRIFQSLGLVIALTGTVYALWEIYSGHIGFHGILGFIVTALGCSQPVNAVLRPDKDSRKRFMWELVHKYFGRTASLLGVLNCVFGAVLARKQHDGETIFDIFLVISLVLCALFCLAYIAGKLWANIKVRQMDQVEQVDVKPATG